MTVEGLKMSIQVRCTTCKSDLSIGVKKCPRCGTVIPKNRKYRVVVRDGTEKITRVVNNLELAREVETSLKNEIIRGEHNLKKHKIPTIGDIWKEYIKWKETERPRSWFTDQFFYDKHIKPTFENTRLDKISQMDVERLLISMKNGSNSYKKKYSDATIRHILVLLSHLYKKASEWGKYRGFNPCTLIRKKKPNNEITEFLKDDQVKRLLDVLETYPDRMGASIVKFALFTGLRRSEIFKLQWGHIDLERSIMLLKNPKSGKDEKMPLSAEAIQVLKQVPHKHDTPFIFYGDHGQQRKSVSTVWAAIKKAAKLPSGFPVSWSSSSLREFSCRCRCEPVHDTTPSQASRSIYNHAVCAPAGEETP